MCCPKCGIQNIYKSSICASCGCDLTTTRPVSPPVQVRISSLAIASFVLGGLSLFTLGLTLLPAIVVGIIALIVIHKSGGRLTGLPFAIVGIVLPVLFLSILIAFLIPAIAKVHQLPSRLACGTNLSGIGKAMLIYANDYEDELPKAGGRSTAWGLVANWAAPDRTTAFDVNATDDAGGKATISSCFYLLVKYAEVTPRSFICKGDAGTTEFRLADVRDPLPSGFELIDAWDFGGAGESWKHCSYSYHLPFGSPYPLTVSSEPSFAVAADRNPWLASPGAAPSIWSSFIPDLSGYRGGTRETAEAGNAITHERKGQNVMFLDTHIEFEKRPYCAIDDDNIYTVSNSTTEGEEYGSQPTLRSLPSCRKDSLLMHDPEQFSHVAGQ